VVPHLQYLDRRYIVVSLSTTTTVTGTISYTVHHIPIWFSYGYQLLIIWIMLLNLITFPLAVTVTAQPPCHVTHHWGEMVHNF